jgi:ARG/rhodanese/phosphatase superfamily protein
MGQKEATMKRGTLSIPISLLAVAIWVAIAASGVPPTSAGQKPSSAEGYEISGSYTHENLSVFLIHGQDKIKDKQFLTLQEAMQQKKVIVHETSNVNELAVENVSGEEVFIQSGDIVKGGKQDRLITLDFVVPPRSGKMPIAAFCVEHGRWQARGREAVAYFASSDAQIATKNLKLAAKYKMNQGEVWKSVGVAQGRLASSAGASVASAESPSSLQLTLENKKVQETSNNYTQKLLPVIEGKRDVIGYAFAINGKVNSADIYASRELFRKLWPKLLKASVVEALAEPANGKKTVPATPEAVRACLADAEKGKRSEKQVTSRIRMVTQETDENLLFETRDREQKDAWIHRNYVTK